MKTSSSRSRISAATSITPASPSRRRANAARSTRQWFSRVAVKWIASPGTALVNASKTSRPISYAPAPAAGPSQAWIRSRGACIASTVASRTPAANPRHPACATATSLPSRAARTTGRQSAVRIASTTPAVRVIAASAPPASAPSSSTPGSISTRVPCTWRNQRGADGRPQRSINAARLRTTSSAASPLRRPRLNASNGGADPPRPCRSVVNPTTPRASPRSAGRVARAAVASMLNGAMAPPPRRRRRRAVP